MSLRVKLRQSSNRRSPPILQIGFGVEARFGGSPDLREVGEARLEQIEQLIVEAERHQTLIFRRSTEDASVC